MGSPYLGRGLIHCAVRWKTYTCFAACAIGATNASFLVPVTLRAMASVLTIDVPTLCRAVSDNSERVYGPWHAERIGQTA